MTAIYQPCILQPVQGTAVNLLPYILLLFHHRIDELFLLPGQLCWNRIYARVYLRTSGLCGIATRILFQDRDYLIEGLGDASIVFGLRIDPDSLGHTAHHDESAIVVDQCPVEVFIHTHVVTDVPFDHLDEFLIHTHRP